MKFLLPLNVFFNEPDKVLHHLLWLENVGMFWGIFIREDMRVHFWVFHWWGLPLYITWPRGFRPAGVHVAQITKYISLRKLNSDFLNKPNVRSYNKSLRRLFFPETADKLRLFDPAFKQNLTAHLINPYK